MKSSPQSRLAISISSRFVFLPVLLTFTLLLLLTACSGVSSGTPSSRTGATTVPTGQPTLSPTPATIDFGIVQLNSEAVTNLVNLINVGKSTETIESATIVPTSIFSLQGWTGPVTLMPGQTIQLRTTFAPKSAGNYYGKLTLITVGSTPVGSPDLSGIRGQIWPPQPVGQVSIPVIGTASADNSNPPPVVSIKVSPVSVSLQSGQSKQFTSTVTGTSNTAVTWTAALGSISSSGFYTAPALTGQVQDAVSAISTVDPTKYASASVVVQGTDGNAVWSLTNQQPVTQPFYPGSIFTTPLPANADTHCWNPAVPQGGSPVACSSTAPDQAIVNNIFSSSDKAGGYSLTQIPVGADSGGQDSSFYYSDATDPIYLIKTGSGPCPSVSINCAAGKYFHLAPGAEWDSTSGDENLTIWDQSTDIDPTPGGRILASYFYDTPPHSTIRSIPTNCSCTTTSCASTTSACQLSLYYNSVNYAFNESNVIGDSNSVVGPSAAGLPRELEIESNVMNHALKLGVSCLQSNGSSSHPNHWVFPASGNLNGCSNTDQNNPLAGNLFWIDSGYNCSALPAWQQPFCTAMQTYGGYVHDTGGAGQGTGIFVYPIEGGLAHNFAGVTDPMFNEPNPTGSTAWIINNAGTLTCPGGAYPKTCTGTNGIEVNEDSATSAHGIVWFIFQMPGLITGGHLHILDPCVAKFMAGQPGGCQ